MGNFGIESVWLCRFGSVRSVSLVVCCVLGDGVVWVGGGIGVSVRFWLCLWFCE